MIDWSRKLTYRQPETYFHYTWGIIMMSMIDHLTIHGVHPASIFQKRNKTWLVVWNINFIFPLILGC